MDITWRETNSYLTGTINNLTELPQPLRIASFDLDDTLIHRPKGKKADGTWKLIDSAIGVKIANLVKRKFIIVIFTNQSGMGSGKNFDKPKWKEAMQEMVEIMFRETKREFYFSVYVAKAYDLYRKPNIGLWDLLKTNLKKEYELDKLEISAKSFFVGDAGGRTSQSPFRKKLYAKSMKDFSDVDRKFALNLKIKYITPEDFFMENPPKEAEYKLEGFDPYTYLENRETTKYKFKPRSKEMIIMVGYPGSGKSTFVNKYIVPHGYVRINQDTCKTEAKCLALTTSALEKGESIVIDNTNPNITTRMKYTMLAKDHGYKHIRCIVMNTDYALAKHLNNVRHLYSNGTIPKINDIVYAIFRKNYIKPRLTENFDVIEEVNFNFDEKLMEDPKWVKAFMKWSEA